MDKDYSHHSEIRPWSRIYLALRSSMKSQLDVFLWQQLWIQMRSQAAFQLDSQLVAQLKGELEEKRKC